MNRKPPTYARSLIYTVAEWLFIGPAAIALAILTLPLWGPVVLAVFAIRGMREDARRRYHEQLSRLEYIRRYGRAADRPS